MNIGTLIHNVTGQIYEAVDIDAFLADVEDAAHWVVREAEAAVDSVEAALGLSEEAQPVGDAPAPVAEVVQEPVVLEPPVVEPSATAVVEAVAPVEEQQ